MFLFIPLYIHNSINGIKSQYAQTCFRAPSHSYGEGALGAKQAGLGAASMKLSCSGLLSGGDHGVDAHLDELVYQLGSRRSSVTQGDVRQLDGKVEEVALQQAAEVSEVRPYLVGAKSLGQLPAVGRSDL